LRRDASLAKREEFIHLKSYKTRLTRLNLQCAYYGAAETKRDAFWLNHIGEIASIVHCPGTLAIRQKS
jgi:hypothetical protein